jgi:hypothetical protein
MPRRPLYPELGHGNPGSHGGREGGVTAALRQPVERSATGARPSRKRVPREQGLLDFAAAETRTALVRPGLSPAERLAGWAQEGEAQDKRRQHAAKFRAQPRTLAQAVEAAKTRIEEERGWAGAAPAELLGLYAVLHAQVYGAAPADLDTCWPAASSAARSLLEREFENDAERVVDFMRWVWRRERGREKHRVANKNGGFRISWRWQFRGRELLTEYRVDLARAQKANGVRRAPSSRT